MIQIRPVSDVRNKCPEIETIFSHQDPKMVEWFVNMVEERKTRIVKKKRKTGKNRKVEKL